MNQNGKLPTTIVTGFLGSGKTTLLRHLLTHADGRRLAVIVNEFGEVGVDGELLRQCGVGCEEDPNAPTPLYELANGCLCCTVQEEFVPVLGTFDDPKLPADSIDLAIMVDVYHEFSEPQKMLQRIRTALKADGRLVLLEYRAEDPNVPILPDHKMTKAQVKQELEHEGFKQSRVYDDLPWQHLFIFTKT